MVVDQGFIIEDRKETYLLITLSTDRGRLKQKSNNQRHGVSGRHIEDYRL